ncbi:MAG: hypothetical protein L0Z62_04750 [Gemmataceae bacterium]|nr:hypothetical protein [Gemmataceae bacterium]
MRTAANGALIGAALLGLLAGGLAHGRGAKQEEAKQLYLRAEELAKARNYEQAADLMNKVIKLAPDNHALLGQTSEMERLAGRYADGVQHALEAIKLTGDKVGPYHLLAAANAYANQDLKLAREYVKKVLDLGESGAGQKGIFDARRLDDVINPKTYTIHWDLEPRRGIVTGGTAIIALPRGDLPGQSVSYEVKGARSHKLVKTEANHLLHVVPQPGKPFRLTTRITLEPHSYKQELEKATRGAIPAAVQLYLGPGEMINPKSPALQKIVAKLRSDDPVQTVRNILKWMHRNLVYKQDDPQNIGKLEFKTVEEIAERGYGECRGYAMLFTALSRAAGVPSRTVWGIIKTPWTPSQPKGNFASHNWSEVYFPGSGWIPVDPQHPESLGWLPSSIVRIFMDSQRSPNTPERLPMRNLVAMNGERINFEVEP